MQRRGTCESCTLGEVKQRTDGVERRGVGKMSHLRAYKWNGGSMLELVRYQRRRKMPAVEKEVLSASEIIRSEHAGGPDWGKYVEGMQVEVSAEIKKWLSIGMNSYIWHLRCPAFRFLWKNPVNFAILTLKRCGIRVDIDKDKLVCTLLCVR